MSDEKKTAELSEEQLDKVQGGVHVSAEPNSGVIGETFQQAETEENSSKAKHEIREHTSLCYQKL